MHKLTKNYGYIYIYHSLCIFTTKYTYLQELCVPNNQALSGSLSYARICYYKSDKCGNYE